jgi:TetR/AcrR family transcriptional repressor of nem operon
VKVSREQVAENRTALVRAAGRMFREHGIDGVGVAEISAEAGLTHGALYAQFASKQDLAAAALAEGLERGHERLTAAAAKAASPLTGVLDSYVSRRHRDDAVQCCAIVASASEIARQDPQVGAELAAGLERSVATVAASLGAGIPPKERRRRALTIVAGMVGAVVLARGTAKPDARLSDEILTAVRAVLGEIGAERAPAAHTSAPTRTRKPRSASTS